MEDNNRLLSIINLIDKNKKVIDIGTDHGLVPLYLAENEISTEILATDISSKSLFKLESRLDNNLSKIIKTKVTDGFKSIEMDENQVAIIAGMGANTIIDIIKASLDFSKNLDYMILASNVNTEKLRLFLTKNGFSLLRDFLVYDNGKYYDILKCKFIDKTSVLSLAYTFYGKDDIENKSDILVQKLKEDYQKNINFKNEILKNSTKKNASDRVDERLDAIREVIDICKLENFYQS